MAVIQQNDTTCCLTRQRADDDWELYLHASRLRGEESGNDEEKEFDSLSSTESIPTYF